MGHVLKPAKILAKCDNELKPLSLSYSIHMQLDDAISRISFFRIFDS